MTPAAAQAMETGTANRAPSSNALRMPTGVIRVSLRRELNTRMEIMAQNAANIGV